MGAELTLQRDRQGRVGSGLTFAARYTGGDYTLTGNVTTSGSVLASYFQRVNEQITVAAELEAVVLEKQRESVVTVGAKFDLRMATLRAQVRRDPPRSFIYDGGRAQLLTLFGDFFAWYIVIVGRSTRWVA